jgi:hypothetical protein
MLVQRFGVFWRPLRVCLTRVPLVIRCAAKLHNLCIDQAFETASLTLDLDDYKYIQSQKGSADVYRYEAG